MSYYSTHDGSDLERAVSGLRQRLGELGDEVEELQDRHRSLDGQVDRIEDRMTTVESAQEDLEDAQRSLGEDLHDDVEKIAATVRALAGTVGWIERRLHAVQDIPRVDLDAADETLRQLAARARQGRTSAAVLLDPSARTVHERRIAALHQLEQEIDTSTESALEHSATLATTEPGSDAYIQAATAYRALAQQLAGRQARLDAARTAATEARRALNLDDKHREVHGPQVMTGESARAQLLGLLRARLEAAVADTALLPAWLVLALGHQPVGDDVAAWMSTATSLLAYRVIYEVVDPVVALGPAAHDDLSARPGATSLRPSSALAGAGRSEGPDSWSMGWPTFSARSGAPFLSGRSGAPRRSYADERCAGTAFEGGLSRGPRHRRAFGRRSGSRCEWGPAGE
uniref:hypothetical protein n=1 Tax=Actinoplanes sp. CA-084688 TaxID=3239901 RepID=UPI003F4919CF